MIIATDLCYEQLIDKYFKIYDDEVGYYLKNGNYLLKILLRQGYNYSNLNQGVRNFIYNKGRLIINSEEYVNLKNKCNYLYSNVSSKVYDLRGSIKKADEIKILVNNFFVTYNELINEMEKLPNILSNLNYDNIDYQRVFNSTALGKDLAYKRTILYEKFKEIVEEN